MLIAADIVLALRSHWSTLSRRRAVGIHMGMTGVYWRQWWRHTAPPEPRGTVSECSNPMSGIALLLASAAAGAGVVEMLGAAPRRFMLAAR